MSIADQSPHTGDGAVELEAPERSGANPRRCLATRASQSRESMIRFVIGPDSALVPDLAGRLPGRGMWVTANRRVIGEAVARNQFAKAARARVEVAPDLPDRLEAMLVRRCMDLIGLARRAGEVVAGFDQCAEALRLKRAALVLEARDGAEEGRRRIEALAGNLPVLDPFDRFELGQALGRDEVVHVAIAEGGIARQLLRELGRLQGFRDFALPSGRRAGSNAEEGASRT